MMAPSFSPVLFRRSVTVAALLACSSIGSAQSGTAAKLSSRSVASLSFSGSATSELFTQEIDASFQGVLEKDFVKTSADGLPAGFVNASPAGQPWNGTMWARDAGTYLRELTMWGDYEDASLLSRCLMQLVEKNEAGYYFYPRYFRGDKRGSGTELDGTSAIVIGLVLLWERLPADDPTRREIQTFLLKDDSPLAYFRVLLKANPLLEGTGEFGCGMQVPGECDNVVQNNLVRLALYSFAEMESRLRMSYRAKEDFNLSEQLRRSMEKYLVAPDGAWLWAVDGKTLAADPKVLNAKANLGFGGTNGVAAMTADVLGLDPTQTEPDIMRHSEKTFADLYTEPKRKEQFDRFGIWTQFDAIGGGVLTSPSYGQGYAIQTMLMTDDFSMADKAMKWLADATYQPIPEYHLSRSSPYFFYERYYSPEAPGHVEMAPGCGALNLVNVAEPLKVARLILGVDDSKPSTTLIVPRLLPSWRKMQAHEWPILSKNGVVRVDIEYERVANGGTLRVKVLGGGELEQLRVRMPSSRGYKWLQQHHVRDITFQTN